MGIVGVDLLDVEVLHVGADVGHAPGDAIVVAHDHAGNAGEAEAGDVPARRVEADLIPDRGHLDAQVRVISQQRQARFGVFAADDPVVATQIGAGAEGSDRRLADDVGRDARPVD